jgi:hypothetical protein
LVLLLALTLPLQHLADLTARLTLVVLALVNLALAGIKARERAPQPQDAPAGAFIAPIWVPWAGCASRVILLILDAVLMV